LEKPYFEEFVYSCGKFNVNKNYIESYQYLKRESRGIDE
jgi:hypothetical protein